MNFDAVKVCLHVNCFLSTPTHLCNTRMSSEKRKRDGPHPRLKLDPPDEIPKPPDLTAFKYKIDDHERIVRADFSSTRYASCLITILVHGGDSDSSDRCAQARFSLILICGPGRIAEFPTLLLRQGGVSSGRPCPGDCRNMVAPMNSKFSGRASS